MSTIVCNSRYFSAIMPYRINTLKDELLEQEKYTVYNNITIDIDNVTTYNYTPHSNITIDIDNVITYNYTPHRYR